MTTTTRPSHLGLGDVPKRLSRAVVRRGLVDRLANERDAPIIMVIASAGYGKTTLLTHLAARVERSTYLRVQARHRDPALLMQDLAVVLGRVTPLAAEFELRLTQRSLEPGLQAASRLADALGGFEGDALLLLDDIHELSDRRAADALSVLIESLPIGLRVVLAGHNASRLRLTRPRAAGQVIEVDEGELVFHEAHVRELAELMGRKLPENVLLAVMKESTGWPVAVSLALDSLRRRPAGGSVGATFMTRSVAEYIRTELVQPLDPAQRAWLLRTSVLDVMSGPLCDEALGVTGSLARLREFERSNLLIQSVNEEATLFRFHPLLQRELRDELEVAMPGEARSIASRAAMWCHEQGESIAALEYARQSEDRDLVARLLAMHVWPLHWSGRIATLENWIDWFDRDGLRDRYVSVCVLAGFMSTIDGRRHKSELWLAAAEHSDDPGPMPDGSDPGSWVAMLRGMLLAGSLDDAEADVQAAEAGMRGDSPFMSGVRLFAAVVCWLAGRTDEAVARMRDAVELAQTVGAWPGFAMASGIEAAIELRLGNTQIARKRIDYALLKLAEVGILDYVLVCIVHAVAARLEALAGNTSQARHHLAHVHRLRPLMTASAPWLSVPVRLEAIEALVALRDAATARTLMREVDEILSVRPHLGILVSDADALRGRLRRMSEVGVGQWTLTAAELRVLQYLPTHLSFSEIAERLYVSPHTVKSQAVAIYGKLGVSSRRTAIETAVEIGLLDGSALRFPLGPGVETGIG